MVVFYEPSHLLKVSLHLQLTSIVFIQHRILPRHSGKPKHKTILFSKILKISNRRYATPKRGLDSNVIETLPVFVHPDVKNHVHVLECAVSLEKFKDGDELRLLLPCNHVFHTKCIDPWLVSSYTCPFCRCNLVPETTLKCRGYCN
ncbi:hypothetical protein MKW92_051398 [Papaver armeniacum]|nr:hypothetical protein MKW92_051398 [Papaver armeniacum]